MSVEDHAYLSAVHGRQEFRRAFREQREHNERLIEALKFVRSRGLMAVAAFVRKNDDRYERMTEVLDVIDTALKGRIE